ncbi:MAG: hypothetical protein KME40_08145 [Komarekiella atlantica HA4396-MV6]|nr:hypothetical protein [Komarekiella atlantica HA4396-MV6]
MTENKPQRRSEKSSQREQLRLRRKRKVRAAVPAVDAHQKACRRHLSFVREATGVGAPASGDSAAKRESAYSVGVRLERRRSVTFQDRGHGEVGV